VINLSLFVVDGVVGLVIVVLLLFLMDTEPGHVLGDGLAELGVADGVDEGVVAGSALGKKSRQHGYQRSDVLVVARHTLDGDDTIGSPAAEPERDIGNGSLGNADLSALGIGFARTKVLDVHLLGLFTHSGFVSEDGLHDEDVRANNDDAGEHEVEEDDAHVVALGVEVLRDVIVAAGVQDALRDVLAPAKEGRKSPANSHDPAESTQCHSRGLGKLRSVEGVADNVVPVVGDHHQGPDAADTSHGTKSSIEFAVEGAEHPSSTTEAVVSEWWEVSSQHDQVGKGQVNNQHISRSLKSLALEIQIDNEAIA